LDLIRQFHKTADLMLSLSLSVNPLYLFSGLVVFRLLPFRRTSVSEPRSVRDDLLLILSFFAGPSPLQRQRESSKARTKSAFGNKDQMLPRVSSTRSCRSANIVNICQNGC
jgi:hypothetical protein